MNAPVFRQIGPYEIQDWVDQGGMGSVYRARDTRSGRTVALKLVRNGAGEEAQEAVAAEKRGAELQRTLLHASSYVPRVHDIGLESGYLYIAMEYVEGEDLSTMIQRGPIEPRRATTIAIQLCQFLEELDRIESGVAGTSALTLLHNDLKPKNIRLSTGDRVTVLDFGAAKTLSMSRRVTSNVFYSTPYLSPECLDSGERDRQTDAWALGVILYEMVAGRTPFHADGTRRLEERIRSRRPAEPPEGCPRALQAVIGKLLAPLPDDRYESATAIREDLERCRAGMSTLAEAEGWPDRVADEPPTRRVRSSETAGTPIVAASGQPPDTEPPTRRTPRPAAEASQTSAPVAPTALPSASSTAGPAAAASRSRPASWLMTALVIVGTVLVANESCVAHRASRLSATVPMQEFPGLTNVWAEYQQLAGRSYLGGIGVHSVEQALTRQTLILAERVVGNYRTPTPTVREAQWNAAASALQRALTVAPSSTQLRGTLRYCEGHLHRINGEASKGRHQTKAADQAFAEAITAFREAAALRPNWPDPFLGLARTFIYGTEDIDRAEDAMNQAKKLGYAIGPRETAQLAEGYRSRGETLERAAEQLAGVPQEVETITRSRDAYRHALELYMTIPTYADVPAHIRLTQRRLDVVEQRLAGGGAPWE